MRSLWIGAALVVAIASGSMAAVWNLTGEGRPFCLDPWHLPERDILLKEAVWSHLQLMEIADRSLAGEEGLGVPKNVPMDIAAVTAFLDANPDCCTIEPVGREQGRVDATVNLLINHDQTRVRVSDRARDPVPYGGVYLVEACAIQRNDS